MRKNCNRFDANDALLPSTFFLLPSLTLFAPGSFRKLALVTGHHARRHLKAILQAAILLIHIRNILEQTGIRSPKLLPFFLFGNLSIYLFYASGRSSPEKYYIWLC